MTRAIVSDTGPLIALARVGHLDLLRRLYGQVIVPPVVHAEFALDSNRPGARALAATLQAGWVVVQPATDMNEAAPFPAMSAPAGGQRRYRIARIGVGPAPVAGFSASGQFEMTTRTSISARRVR